MGRKNELRTGPGLGFFLAAQTVGAFLGAAQHQQPIIAEIVGQFGAARGVLPRVAHLRGLAFENDLVFAGIELGPLSETLALRRTRRRGRFDDFDRATGDGFFEAAAGGSRAAPARRRDCLPSHAAPRGAAPLRLGSPPAASPRRTAWHRREPRPAAAGLARTSPYHRPGSAAGSFAFLGDHAHHVPLGGQLLLMPFDANLFGLDAIGSLP